MKRAVTALGVTLGAACALLITSQAHAQQQTYLGQRGTFIISADRLVPFIGFSHESENLQTGAGVSKATATSSQTTVSLLYGSTVDADDLFYTVPRVGFDYVVAPNVTIGGDLVIFFTPSSKVGGETDFTNGTTMTSSSNSATNTIFGIAPRGGYVLGINNLFSFWFRGGFSFYDLSQKPSGNNNNNTGTTVTDSVHQFSLDLDPQFVVTPIPHVAFTAGLTADIPLVGGHSTETDTGNTQSTFSASSSVFYFGVTLGMLAYF